MYDHKMTNDPIVDAIRCGFTTREAIGVYLGTSITQTVALADKAAAYGFVEECQQGVSYYYRIAPLKPLMVEEVVEAFRENPQSWLSQIIENLKRPELVVAPVFKEAIDRGLIKEDHHNYYSVVEEQTS